MEEVYPEEFYRIVGNTTKAQTRNPLLLDGKGVQENNPPHISSLFVDPRDKRICGDDDERTLSDARVTPNNTICRLILKDKRGNEYTGTGFFISPRCVVTSGHCVFFRKTWMSSVTVIPGDNGINDRAPFGSQESFKFKSVHGWVNKHNRCFDYGAIILPDNSLHDKINDFLNLKVYENELELFNYGYTAESDKIYEQWGSIGEMQSATDTRIYYMNDTEDGNSGSPILVRRSDKFYVVGIHSYGACPNFCIRINNSILQVWEEWKKL